MDLLFALLMAGLLKATLLLLLVHVSARLLRRQAAALHHLVWLLTLLALPCIVFGSLFVPIWNVLSLPASHAPRAARFVSIQRPPSTSLVHSENDAATGKTTPLQAGLAAAPVTPSLVPRALPWTWAALALWIGGSVLVLLRCVGHWRVLRRLRRHSAVLVSAPAEAARNRAGAKLALNRLPTLLVSPSEAGLFSPMTWGWRRAFVLLPAEAQTWPAARLEAVLLHELAHIRRGDWITQRLVDLVCAVLWFHPLVWTAAQRLREAAEQACDDAVVTGGIQPAEYAEHLLALARRLRAARSEPAVALPIVRRLPIEQRLQALLNVSLRRHLSKGATCVVVVAGMGLLVPLVAFLPLAVQGRGFVTPLRSFVTQSLQERYNQQLIAAIHKHDALAVETWLQRGADPNCQVPMRVYLQNPSTPLVEALLGNEGEGDLPPDFPAITRSLLQHGAEVSRMGWGWSPIQAAASRGKAASLQLLLQQGANANQGKGTEWPALFYAAVTPAMARQMLAYGADVNMTDDAGKTALMWAYERHYYPTSLEMAQVLLAHGADARRKDKAGASPLSLAAQEKEDPSPQSWYAILQRATSKAK